MAQQFKIRRVAVALVIVLLVATGLAWQLSLLPIGQAQPNNNSLIVLAPYRYNGTWVFDDPSVGLVREPFVAGVPEMIDRLVADIPDADKGFRMVVCPQPFPGYEKKLTWLRRGGMGNWYRLENTPPELLTADAAKQEPVLEGWICPALFRYYSEAPDELFVMAEAIERQ